MQFSKNQKYCATCMYWSGERKLAMSGTYITVDPNERGACQHPTSTSRHINNMGAVFRCNKHELWKAIK